MKITTLNPFTLDRDSHASKHGFACEGESMTVQADAQSADINYIVKQFGLTKQLPYGNIQPFYDDITDFPTDYHEAQNFIIASNDAFMTLPADQRSRFNNDAGQFLNFLNNPDNYDEASKYGFVNPPVSATPAEQETGGQQAAGAQDAQSTT